MIGEPAWPGIIRSLRAGRRLNVLEFAQLAQSSVGSIRAYESGRRRPKLSTAKRLLTGLGAGAQETAALAAALDIDAAAFSVKPRSALPNIGMQDLEREIDALPWPALLLSDSLELVAASSILQRLWRLNLRYDCREPWQRNALRLLCLPQLRQHLGNWREIMTMLLGVYKAQPNGVDLLYPTEYVQRILAEVSATAPEVTAKLLALWQEANALPAPGARTGYEIVWLEDGGALHFRGLGAKHSNAPWLGIHEWHPVDEATLRMLRELRRVA